MRKNKSNKSKIKNIRMLRITIIFIVMAIIVVMGSTLIAQRFFANKQYVQALDINKDVNQNSNNNKDENQSSTNDKDDTANNGQPNNSQATESNSEVEDVAFVEKYLDQQMKGEKPDGADGKKVVYLTFDDGPSETVTPKILNTLKEENVHATFFLIGKYIEQNDVSKNLVKQEVEEGNAVGIHSYSHNYNYLYPSGKISLDNCMSDFNKTDQALKNVLGQDFSTRAIRFPGGQMTWSKKDPKGAEVMDDAIHKNDWHQIDWNALSGDAEGGKKNAQQLTQEAIKTIGKREKVVMLMHDTYGKEETAKALPGIIKYLKEQGYEFKVLK